MRRSVTAVLTAAILCVSLVVLAAPALAHETASAGALSLELGWGTEPAYVGQLNSVQFIVTHEADGDPVNDLGARLTATISYGDQKQDVPLTPTYDAASGTGTPGEYAGLVIPTAPGDYTFRVTGSIEGTKVALKVTSSPKTFSPVKEASAIQFPVKVPGAEQVAQKLDAQLPRLAVADEVSEEISGEVSSAKTLGYIGIAVGAVGIVLAAGALLVRRRA